MGWCGVGGLVGGLTVIIMQVSVHIELQCYYQLELSLAIYPGFNLCHWSIMQWLAMSLIRNMYKQIQREILAVWSHEAVIKTREAVWNKMFKTRKYTQCALAKINQARLVDKFHNTDTYTHLALHPWIFSNILYETHHTLPDIHSYHELGGVEGFAPELFIGWDISRLTVLGTPSNKVFCF